MCTWSSGQTVVAGSCCGRRNKNRIGGKSGINKGYLKFSRQFECFQLRLGNTTIILLLKGCGLQNKSFRILKCILTRVGEVGFNVFCSLMLTFFSQLQLKLGGRLFWYVNFLNRTYECVCKWSSSNLLKLVTGNGVPSLKVLYTQLFKGKSSK
jgi:hypothetical protein